jgi:hypothetical protein
MLISSAVFKSSDYTVTIRGMVDGKLSIMVGDRSEEGLDPVELLEAIKRAPRGNNHKFETHQFITGAVGSIGIISNEGQHSLVFDDGEELSSLLPIDLSVLESAIRSCVPAPEIKLPPLPTTDPYYPRPNWIRPEWERRNEQFTPSWPPGTVTCGVSGAAAIPNNHVYVNGVRVR